MDSGPVTVRAVEYGDRKGLAVVSPFTSSSMREAAHDAILQEIDLDDYGIGDEVATVEFHDVLGDWSFEFEVSA